MNSTLCDACHTGLPWQQHACPKCANPLSSAETVCADCIKNPPPYDSALAIFDYQPPIDFCILSLKFQEKLVYAKFLGDIMVNVLQKQNPLPEYILPVPLHPKRQKERGFNQALELARPLSKTLKIPLAKNACKRIFSTKSQANTSAEQRRRNLKNAFLIQKNFHANHVAILDDVMTTGSTVAEIARALKKAGIKRVDIWCCARTGLKNT